MTYTVSANPPAGTSSGSYSGSVILTPLGGSPLTVPVTVTLGSPGTLSLTPGMLSFAYQTGTSFPPAQSVAVASTGGSLSFAVNATTTSGGNWLIVTPQIGSTAGAGTAPAALSVQVNPTGLAPALYQGQITVTGNGASNGAQSIP